MSRTAGNSDAAGRVERTRIDQLGIAPTNVEAGMYNSALDGTVKPPRQRASDFARFEVVVYGALPESATGRFSNPCRRASAIAFACASHSDRGCWYQFVA